jgi:hypothetical protein
MDEEAPFQTETLKNLIEMKGFFTDARCTVKYSRRGMDKAFLESTR